MLIALTGEREDKSQKAFLPLKESHTQKKWRLSEEEPSRAKLVQFIRA